MISITSDKSRSLLIAQMSGFFEPTDVQRFSDEKDAAVAAMGLGSGEYYMLVNTEGCVIQSQEVVATFMRVILQSPFRSRRLAVVRNDNLTRLQTRRILSVRDEAEMFASMTEAEQWLFDAPVERRVALG
ncbi:hypothetical protein ASE85_02045 [Sphingobium sp. Leaf26]|uniref:hypothetical protein n=1 Tax=Sphingobium sp. Leaf26 TaxID=1735693 RepID=UPI0006F9188D|nr:hypothetical protein [Sphingobium sp. Leaf26]KQN09746.1 hypothetical protein ASE85_02045 [Sphingobium sp. Leaf26]